MSSPYLLAIHGNLVIVGYQPDGDSIRFIADDPSLFDDLYRGYKIRLGPRDGSAQLRLEAIDAPETHYGRAAQPLGETARDWLLGQLGFTDVTYETGNTTVVSAAPDAVPAVIYTKASDPNGRPISYLQVGSGRRPNDGTWTPVTNSVLDRTLNATRCPPASRIPRSTPPRPRRTCGTCGRWPAARARTRPAYGRSTRPRSSSWSTSAPST